MREAASKPDALDGIARDWSTLFAAHGQSPLDADITEWLSHQRWFGAKTRKIQKLKVLASVDLPATDGLDAESPPIGDVPFDDSVPPALFYLEVTYVDGSPDIFQVPFAYSTGKAADRIRADHPLSIIATLAQLAGEGVLYDATVREDFRQALLLLIERNATLALSSRPNVVLSAHPSSAFGAVRGTGDLPGRIGSAEQSNTSIIYGKDLILKLFRRLQQGENPDVEVGRFLTEVAHFPRIAPFLGEMDITLDGSEKTTIAMLQGLVLNQGDGWQWFQEQLGSFFQAVGSVPVPNEIPTASFLGEATIPPELRHHSGEALAAAALLGRRTAELHLALATPTEDQAFCAEALIAEDLSRDAVRIQVQIESAIEALKASFSALPVDLVEPSAMLISRQREFLDRVSNLANGRAGGKRIRIHGDYHLGQTLRVAGDDRNHGFSAAEAGGDFILLDFEGEPARPLAERRRKESPLRDVAGMIRSFSYAAQSALALFLDAQEVDSAINLRSWTRLWENAACGEFLRAFRTTIAADPTLLPPPEQAQALLSSYVLEKALYELMYELNNRPDWLPIPLAGILSM